VSLIDIDAFHSISLAAEPFPHAGVPNFIRRRSLPAVIADYPDVSQGGSFPVNALTYGPTFVNWVTDERAAQSVARRHGLSALFKRMNPSSGVA
jgi:hypothetical protein